MALKNKDEMKRTIITAILALAILWGCGEDKPVTPVDPQVSLTEQVTGEWHCSFPEADADIYLDMSEDSSFELYQRIGDGRYRLYRGTWNLDEASAKLTGKYNDGESWGSGYAVSVSEDGTVMTLVPESGQEEHRYMSESIPEEVRTDCEVVVKSCGAEL